MLQSETNVSAFTAEGTSGAVGDRICLNCGSVVSKGNYCPECGQHLSTARLTMKNLAVNTLSGLARVNDKFFFTCGMLLTKPWKVVAEYISGKRARYTAPIQLIIVITFIFVTLDSFLGIEGSEDKVVFLYGEGAYKTYVNGFVNYLFDSSIILGLCLFLPTVPLLYLTHRMFKIKRFNAAEYIVASMYLSVTFVILIGTCQLVVDYFFEHIYGSYEVIISVSYVIVLGIISVYKSLNSSGKNKAAKILTSATFIFLVLLMYFVTILGLVFIHRLSINGQI